MAAGEFLGENNDRSLDVLRQMASLLHFKGLSFVDALRKFLAAFRLPGVILLRTVFWCM